MNSEKENLSAEQSLDLISQMIRQAQGNVLNNSFYFLLWGWVITLCNFGMYGLMKLTSYPHPYIVWLLSIPAWIVSMIYGMRQGKQAVTQTHLDRITMWMWIFLGLTILPIVFFGYKINYQINPISLIMLSAPTFLAGIILKFRALVFGGISFYCFGIAAFAVDFQTQYLLGGIAMIIGNLIPGYMLKAQKR